MGEQPGGLGDGERDHSRVGGRGLVRPDRGGCPGVGAAAEQGGGGGADGQAAMTSAVCRAMAVNSRAWDSSSPKQPFADRKSSSTGQQQPAARTSRVSDTGWLAGTKQ